MIQSQTGSRFRFQKAISLGPRDPKACQHTSWDIPELEIPKIGQFLRGNRFTFFTESRGKERDLQASIFGCSGTKLAAKFMGIQGNSLLMPPLSRKQPALLRDYLPPRGGGKLPIACWCNLDEWPLQQWLYYPWISIKRMSNIHRMMELKHQRTN